MKMNFCRIKQLPGGRIETVIIPRCTCSDRRGPKDGVCGNCGGAIPGDKDE